MSPPSLRPAALLPESPAEIARIYDEITGLREPMTLLDAQAIQMSGPVMAGWTFDAIGLLLLFGYLSILPMLAIVPLVIPGGFLIDSYRSARRRARDGDAMPNTPLWAIGPLSRLAIGRGIAEWRRDHRRDPARPVDTTSLEILEPVARHLAGPILLRARAVSFTSSGGSDEKAAARAETRRDELLAQAERETDPVWGRAAREQADRLSAKASALRARAEAEAAARLRVREDVRALESYLARLGERKRLLRDMAESRADLPGEFDAAPDLAGTETIRANLAALTASLVETEALALARAEAELEADAHDHGRA